MLRTEFRKRYLKGRSGPAHRFPLLGLEVIVTAAAVVGLLQPDKLAVGLEEGWEQLYLWAGQGAGYLVGVSQDLGRLLSGAVFHNWTQAIDEMSWAWIMGGGLLGIAIPGILLWINNYINLRKHKKAERPALSPEESGELQLVCRKVWAAERRMALFELERFIVPLLAVGAGLYLTQRLFLYYFVFPPIFLGSGLIGFIGYTLFIFSQKLFKQKAFLSSVIVVLDTKLGLKQGLPTLFENTSAKSISNLYRILLRQVAGRVKKIEKIGLRRFFPHKFPRLTPTNFGLPLIGLLLFSSASTAAFPVFISLSKLLPLLTRQPAVAAVDEGAGFSELSSSPIEETLKQEAYELKLLSDELETSPEFSRPNLNNIIPQLRKLSQGLIELSEQDIQEIEAPPIYNLKFGDVPIRISSTKYETRNVTSNYRESLISNFIHTTDNNKLGTDNSSESKSDVVMADDKKQLSPENKRPPPPAGEPDRSHTFPEFHRQLAGELRNLALELINYSPDDLEGDTYPLPYSPPYNPGGNSLSTQKEPEDNTLTSKRIAEEKEKLISNIRMSIKNPVLRKLIEERLLSSKFNASATGALPQIKPANQKSKTDRQLPPQTEVDTQPERPLSQSPPESGRMPNGRLPSKQHDATAALPTPNNDNKRNQSLFDIFENIKNYKIEETGINKLRQLMDELGGILEPDRAPQTANYQAQDNERWGRKSLVNLGDIEETRDLISQGGRGVAELKAAVISGESKSGLDHDRDFDRIRIERAPKHPPVHNKITNISLDLERLGNEMINWEVTRRDSIVSGTGKIGNTLLLQTTGLGDGNHGGNRELFADSQNKLQSLDRQLKSSPDSEERQEITQELADTAQEMGDLAFGLLSGRISPPQAFDKELLQSPLNMDGREGSSANSQTQPHRAGKPGKTPDVQVGEETQGQNFSGSGEQWLPEPAFTPEALRSIARNGERVTELAQILRELDQEPTLLSHLLKDISGELGQMKLPASATHIRDLKTAAEEVSSQLAQDLTNQHRKTQENNSRPIAEEAQTSSSGLRQIEGMVDNLDWILHQRKNKPTVTPGQSQGMNMLEEVGRKLEQLSQRLLSDRGVAQTSEFTDELMELSDRLRKLQNNKNPEPANPEPANPEPARNNQSISPTLVDAMVDNEKRLRDILERLRQDINMSKLNVIGLELSQLGENLSRVLDEQTVGDRDKLQKLGKVTRQLKRSGRDLIEMQQSPQKILGDRKKARRIVERTIKKQLEYITKLNNVSKLSSASRPKDGSAAGSEPNKPSGSKTPGADFDKSSRIGEIAQRLNEIGLDFQERKRSSPETSPISQLTAKKPHPPSAPENKRQKAISMLETTLDSLKRHKNSLIQQDKLEKKVKKVSTQAQAQAVRNNAGMDSRPERSSSLKNWSGNLSAAKELDTSSRSEFIDNAYPMNESLARHDALERIIARIERQKRRLEDKAEIAYHKADMAVDIVERNARKRTGTFNQPPDLPEDLRGLTPSEIKRQPNIAPPPGPRKSPVTEEPLSFSDDTGESKLPDIFIEIRNLFTTANKRKNLPHKNYPKEKLSSGVNLAPEQSEESSVSHQPVPLTYKNIIEQLYL